MCFPEFRIFEFQTNQEGFSNLERKKKLAQLRSVLSESDSEKFTKIRNSEFWGQKYVCGGHKMKKNGFK